MPSVYDEKPWLRTYPDWLSVEFPETYETILHKFRKAVSARPNDPCMYFFDTPISYSKTAQLAEAMAAAFAGMGFGKGDRILFVLQNTPQVFIASLAVWMRGGIVVPVNPMYLAKDLAHLISDSGAKLIVCEDVLYEKNVRPAVGGCKAITTSALDFLGKEQEIPQQLASQKKMVFGEAIDFLDLLEKYKGQKGKEEPPGPEDIAYLVYTSGTTGPPKGAMISHANVDHNCRVYESTVRLDGSDVILGIAPLFHITGIVAHQAIAFHLGISRGAPQPV